MKYYEKMDIMFKKLYLEYPGTNFLEYNIKKINKKYEIRKIEPDQNSIRGNKII